MAYVYILKSLSSKRYYIGSTKNLTDRIRHHFAGATPTTKRFGHIQLVFKQEYKTLREARYIEKRLHR